MAGQYWGVHFQTCLVFSDDCSWVSHQASGSSTSQQGCHVEAFLYNHLGGLEASVSELMSMHRA